MQVIPFHNVQTALTEKFKSITENRKPLFRVDLDKDVLWNLYLDSFPEGTNEIFRKRREYDCSCCRQFIRNIGNVVYLTDNYEVRSIWRIPVGGQFQNSFDAMADYAESFPISNVFLTQETGVGTAKNVEISTDGGPTIIWEHFFLRIPEYLRVRSSAHIPDLLNEYRVSQTMHYRTMTEVTPETFDVVERLVNSGVLDHVSRYTQVFRKVKETQNELRSSGYTETQINNFCWGVVGAVKATELEKKNPFLRFRNCPLGVLLVDMNEGKREGDVIAAYNTMVAPMNYRRSTATATTGMIRSAKDKLVAEGFMSIFTRRMANPSDLDINNMLFVDRSAMLPVDPFASIENAAGVSEAKLDKTAVAITFEDFLITVIPGSKSLEMYFGGNITSHLMTLVAPESSEDKVITTWDNNVSWYYKGDGTSAIAERVKRAGGNVDGDPRISLGWYNGDDLDLRVTEPQQSREENPYVIYYANKRTLSPCGGVLDVDMNAMGVYNSEDPVENITYTSRDKMIPGDYVIEVHQYNLRSRSNVGFTVEIKLDGKLTTLQCDRIIRDNELVPVAMFTVGKDKTITLKPYLPVVTQNNIDSRKVWGLSSKQFHKVTHVLPSPNFWGGNATGLIHTFFLIEGCRCDEKVRRFYNEFVTHDLNKHRKVLEAVGTENMIQPDKEEQASGLGFVPNDKTPAYIRVDKNKVYKVSF